MVFGGAMSTCLLMCKRDEIGAMFYRAIGLFSALVTLPGLILSWKQTGPTLALGLMGFVLLVQVLLVILQGGPEKVFKGLLVLTGLAVMVVLGLQTGNLLVGLDLALGAALLGCVTFTMILGHWYLVNRKLAFDHLERGTRGYLWLSLLRPGVWLFLPLLATGEQLSSLVDPAALGLYVLPRTLFGWLLPLIGAFMVLATVKIRNNQSATGILYATTVLVMGGEMGGFFLTSMTGLPL